MLKIREKIKKFSICVLVFQSTLLFSQYYTIGYFPSLKNIYMNEGNGGYKGLPSDFKYFKEWNQKSTKKVFITDLQHSGGEFNSYNSLGLIFRFDYDFNFLNTGFIFSANKKKELRDKPINVIANNSWKAYDSYFDFSELKEKNQQNHFFLIRRALNITKQQSLAHFINEYSSSFSNSNISGMKQFIRDVNQVYKSNFPESFADNNTNTVSQLLEAMNKHYPSDDANILAFYTYINPSNEKKDEEVVKNIRRYYRGLSGSSIDKTFNDFYMPEGNIEFLQKNATLSLPNNLFYSKERNDKSNINFNIRDVQHHIEYNLETGDYTFYIEIIPYVNTLSSGFKFISKYQDALKPKETVAELDVTMKDFQDLLFVLTKDKIEVFVEYNINGFKVKRKLNNIFFVKNIK